VTAARQALGGQVLGYALGPPGTPAEAGYRGLFAAMGFGEVLRELEARRDRGVPLSELVDAAPDQLLQAVGYYGPAAGRRPPSPGSAPGWTRPSSGSSRPAPAWNR
jgi:hypothetical protein